MDTQSKNHFPKSDENFLKEFLSDFYQKIVITYTNGIDDLENIIINNCINNIKGTRDDHFKIVIGSMENHEQRELWFSSLIGYFYQHGIGRKENKNKALQL